MDLFDDEELFKEQKKKVKRFMISPLILKGRYSIVVNLCENGGLI